MTILCWYGYYTCLTLISAAVPFWMNKCSQSCKNTHHLAKSVYTPMSIIFINFFSTKKKTCLIQVVINHVNLLSFIAIFLVKQNTKNSISSEEHCIVQHTSQHKNTQMFYDCAFKPNRIKSYFILRS